LQEIKSRYIAFVDDNLIGYNRESIDRSKRLFRGMIQQNLDKRWWMQTSINAADDEEVIQLAAEAGCMFVFIGFEAVSLESLKEMRKGINIRTGVDNYQHVVDIFHKYGIGVFGAFIIGNDNESSDYYGELGDFLVRSGIDMFQISILTPLPGTEFMDQMIKEDRLIYQDFPGDWDKYRFSYMVHTPHKIEVDTVYRADNYIKNKIYSFPAYHMRLLRALCSPNRFKSFYAVYKLNQALKKSWENAHFYKKYGKELRMLER
jgi:radical SAM superfamily enzyme YgiQ (UPF0313 family)